MKQILDTKYDFQDVLIEPCPTELTSRKEPELSTSFKTLSNNYLTGIPVISANMSTVTTMEMAQAMAHNGMFSALHKHYDVNELAHFYKIMLTDHSRVRTFITFGMADYDKFLKFGDMVGESPHLICLDVANGYMSKFLDYVERIRLKSPHSVIMAGNVVTPEGAINLIDAGTDIVKVGIGSSAVCRTRTMTGVGIPQLSAILDTIDIVNDMGALLCSDGGCTTPADFSKAFGAGAHFVMSGTMFAGHDECGGKVVDNKMEFYGMSSETAMTNHHGGMADYRTSEGIRTMVPYKGPVINTINKIKGGIASTMTYTNSKTLYDLRKNVKFHKVNRTYNNIFGE